MSSWFLALWQGLVSSANLDILLTIFMSISFIYIYIRNSSVPNTLPCGTPDVTGALTIGLVDAYPLATTS